MQLKHLGIAILLVGTTLFGADIPVTTNVDATVTFRVGSNNTVVDFVGGVEKIASLSWLTSTSTVTIEAVSKHGMYKDTTYTTSITVSSSSYPAWNATTAYTAAQRVSYNGKDYEAQWWTQGNTPSDGGPWKAIAGEEPAKVLVTLPRVPYSIDTAYIPVKGNKNFTLTAYPLSMIEGGVPTAPLVFNLTANSLDTLKVPVRTTLTSPVGSLPQVQSKSLVITRSAGSLHLAMPEAYLGGMMKVVSISGRQVSSMEFSSPTKNSLSVWDVAPGMYVLQVISKSGLASAQKFQHNGGDLRIATTFHTPQAVAVQSQPMTASKARAATAQYRFEAKTGIAGYSDQSNLFDLTGQLQSPIEYTFINPESPSSNFQTFVDENLFNQLFPHRYGYDPNYASSQPGGDFYTYATLMEAMDELATMRATIYTKETSGGDKVVVTYGDGSTHTYYSIAGYEANTSPETIRNVAYKTFLSTGNVDIIKAEFVAFLAHISSETTGGWDAAPDGRWAWGLHFLHEVSYSNSSVGGYVSPGHSIYPPVAGQSYHGRGPKQISYNYNYGQLSDFLYKDKSLLLNNPNRVSSEAKLAWMSAIWFWMTPQGKKPSCHMVMSETWIPTQHDIDGGRTISKFGQTTNIINGGVECGSSFLSDNDVKRQGHYNFFSNILATIPEDELGCRDIKNYNEW